MVSRSVVALSRCRPTRLASTPTGEVARISPIVPGVDLVGVLLEDASDLVAGTEVIALSGASNRRASNGPTPPSGSSVGWRV